MNYESLSDVCFLSEVSSASSLSEMKVWWLQFNLLSIQVFDGRIFRQFHSLCHMFPTGKSEALYLLWQVDQESARELWMLACND